MIHADPSGRLSCVFTFVLFEYNFVWLLVLRSAALVSGGRVAPRAVPRPRQLVTRLTLTSLTHTRQAHTRARTSFVFLHRHTVSIL